MAYALLAVAYAWRLAGYRREFLAAARDPGRAFAFFTFTAASDVLAGAQILELPPDPLSTSVRDVVADLSVVLWPSGPG